MVNTGIQPSQVDVNNVCEVTGVDRVQAIVLLKVSWVSWE